MAILPEMVGHMALIFLKPSGQAAKGNAAWPVNGRCRVLRVSGFSGLEEALETGCDLSFGGGHRILDDTEGAK